VTERQLDNIRIATRALTYFVVSMGLYFVSAFATSFFLVRYEASEDIYPHEASNIELFLSFLLLLPLFLAFVLPIIVVVREIRDRKERQNLKSILT